MKCPNKKSQQYKELLEIANGSELIANHMWYTLDRLKQEGYITKNRFKAGSKFAYTIPKIEDNYSLSKNPFGKAKDLKTKNKLEQLLEDNMIDWIDVVETNKAFVIKLSIPELDLPITKNESIVNLEEVLEKLDDYQLSEQALKEQELAEDKELQIKQPSKTNIKPGVSELFESNPELANVVYEAAGIRNPNITVLPNGNLKIVAFRTEKVGPTSKGEYQRGKGLYLSLDKPYPGEDVYTVEIEISPKNLLDRKLGFGEISEDYFIDEKNKRVDKQLDTLHEFKQSLGIKAEIGSIDGALMNELVLFDKDLIDKALSSKQVYNPQQKQQAQQLYSQYLDTIFPDSKVKDIVYHGANEPIEGENFTKREGATGGGIWFSGSKKYAQIQMDRAQPSESLIGRKLRGGPTMYRVLLNIKNPKNFYDATGALLVQTPREFEKQYDKKTNDGALFHHPNSKKPITADSADQVVVFEPEQIHILGSKEDIEGFKEFVKQPIKQQGQLSLFTEEDFNQKFPNFAELQPFEKKIINDNKDEDLDIQCKL